MPKLLPLIAFGLLAAAPASAQQTVTLDQAGRDDRALRDQFWGIFEPEAPRPRARTRSSGDSVMLRSRPYPTEYPGLCRQDHTVLLFAPAQDGVREPAAATPMRAYGVDNTPYYRFYRAPGSEAPDFNDPWPGGVWNGPCSRLVWERGWFKAPDEETAFEGYRAFLSARTALTSRRVRLGRCHPLSDRGYFCREIFAETEPPILQSIRRCDARRNTACFVAEIGGSMHVRIVVTQDFEGYGDDTPMRMLNARVAGRVLSVDVDFDRTERFGVD